MSRIDLPPDETSDDDETSDEVTGPTPAVVPVEEPDAAEGSTRRRLPRILGRIGAVVVVGLILVAVFAPALAPYDPTERVDTPFLEPSAAHPLGTNDVGQDLLSELIFGTRVSLTVGLVAATVALLIGGTIGVLAGYYPRRLGAVLMRGVDVVLILPFLPLLIVLAAYLGRSLLTTTLVIGSLIWAGTTRVLRSQVLSLARGTTSLRPSRWAPVTGGRSDITCCRAPPCWRRASSSRQPPARSCWKRP